MNVVGAIGAGYVDKGVNVDTICHWSRLGGEWGECGWCHWSRLGGQRGECGWCQ